MCGIAGYYGNEPLEAERVKRAFESMSNRGPDAEGHFHEEKNGKHVHLLHSRLSIIDLDERSNQPWCAGNHVTVFNGEIYNYKELKATIQDDWKTEGDTEVLGKVLLGQTQYSINDLQGMWAFANYNRNSGELLLSRDRFGEKPLYLAQTPQGIFFASETNTLRALSGSDFKVDMTQIKRFLVNGHKSLYKQKSTFYKGVEEVDFASNWTISNDLQISKSPYWSPQYNPTDITEEDAVKGVRELLISSVERKMRSDVPLAFCLSGGVDSSSLVSIASKELELDVHTFSIVDSDKRYHELENMEATIKDTGCSNTIVHLDPKENYLERLKDLVAYHDAPVATISYLVHSLLSEQISNHGYKISISGTGADEIFTGYYDHFPLHAYEMKDEVLFHDLQRDWEKYQKPFVRHPAFRNFQFYFDDPSKRDHIYLNNDIFSDCLIDSYTDSFKETQYSSSLLRSRMMNEMFHEVVRVILHEDDLNSMKYSIENRSPFLDKELFEFANSIPSKYLIKGGYAKHLLRDSMNGILNDTVRLSREKKGFNASLESLIDLQKPEHLQFLLEDSPIFEIVRRSSIENLLKRKEFPNSYKKFLFNFISVKMFLESTN